MDMSRVIDLTGKTFGSWRVLRFSHAVGSMAYWHCKCICGTERDVFGADLKRGSSVNCGCVRKAAFVTKSTDHGMSRHPAYRSWLYMRERCQNPHCTSYYLYGGRGITVSIKWESFNQFWKDMGPTWRPGLSIDRINNDGNYEPGNCRWATPKQQARNRRTEHLINTPKGRMSVTEAGEQFGVSKLTIMSRLRYGWTDPERLVQPARKQKK